MKILSIALLQASALAIRLTTHDENFQFKLNVGKKNPDGTLADVYGCDSVDGEVWCLNLRENLAYPVMSACSKDDNDVLRCDSDRAEDPWRDFDLE